MIFKIVFVFICIELCLVSYQDIKKKKISNFYTLINILIAIFLYGFDESYQLRNFSFLIYPLGFFVFGFVLFYFGIMGGGDSKLMTSLCLILPQTFHKFFFENIVILTLLTSLILIMLRFLKSNHSIIKMRKTYYSFAPVILFAWVLTGKKIWL